MATTEIITTDTGLNTTRLPHDCWRQQRLESHHRRLSVFDRGRRHASKQPPLPPATAAVRTTTVAVVARRTETPPPPSLMVAAVTTACGSTTAAIERHHRRRSRNQSSSSSSLNHRRRNRRQQHRPPSPFGGPFDRSPPPPPPQNGGAVVDNQSPPVADRRLRLSIDATATTIGGAVVVMSFFHEESYVYESRVNHSTNELEKIFFAHPKSLEFWHAFPHVVLIDATYQTNSHALDIIFKEYERAKVVGSLAENCGCQLRTSHGLPCAHEQSMYLNKHQPIPLDSLDLFWRKLDLSPCISMKDDDIGCEAELEMLNAQFKKQSRSGKRSLLRKFVEIIAPSTTLVREPANHTATCGRPSLKTQSFRKTRVEKPSEPQESCRRSYSSAPKVGE
ncbi:hypothetical protein OSB04_002959 [Centaurea solstitialis]|uniref:SWIM-type domain-containing protein n=1 Tax=Centaurea solstitialis TaxID=347529 RepID=A0AA38UBY6_9ASTR|nr:hypothetical protein OSB04_002959 [Centaurea solstitialis]